ncbi:MAG: hypothetical protein V1722_00585 [Candidatus Micrarchaeota archaeon]
MVAATERITNPIFSAKTRLVFAELDRSLPVDEKALAEMERRKVIIRVKNHAGLRSNFEEAGKKPEEYEHLYAIPFRKPVHPLEVPESRTIHRRSIHTFNLPNRQFVFKGTGVDDAPVSFGRRTHSIREQEFYGGATLEGIKAAVETLQTLEQEYETAKLEKDPIVSWAKEHGVKELPVIKHAAVFKPLQFAALPKWHESGKRRVAITKAEFDAHGLGNFFGEERVHTYSASRPERISEFALSDPTKNWIRSYIKVKNIDKRTKRKLLKQFVVRGLLLLHIADKSKIGLWQDRMGSPFAQRNASPVEFFDFDTGHNSNLRSPSERAEAIEEFAETIDTFGKKLNDKRKERSEYLRGDLQRYIYAALNHAHKNNLKEMEQELDKIINRSLR